MECFPPSGIHHGGGNTNEPNWFIYWKDGAVAGIPNNAIYDAQQIMAMLCQV
jgi:hypothetical protein